jgi:hypothetical protein
MKREADYKAALMRELRARLTGFVCQRIEDRFTSGWPDIEVIGKARTSYWEAKHADPSWTTHGIQELTMMRLAAASFHARYIIWEEKRGVKRTLIVHPKNLGDLQPESFCVGFNMTWLVEQIQQVHSV